MGGSWVLLALAALVTTCAYSVSMKWLLTDADRADPILVSAVVFTLVGAGSTGLWALAGAPATDLAALRDVATLELVTLDISLYTLGSLLYYRALRALPVSQVAILHASVGVFTLVGGALSGTEAVTVARCGGAALIVVAVAVAHARGEGGGAGRSMVALAVACAFYAAGAMVDKRLVSASGLSEALVVGVAYLVPGVALLAVGLTREGQGFGALGALLRRRPVYANAAVLAATYLCVYGAYGAGGPASGVTLILAAEAVLVVVLAAALLGERDQLARKLVAGVLVAVGVRLVG